MKKEFQIKFSIKCILGQKNTSFRQSTYNLYCIPSRKILAFITSLHEANKNEFCKSLVIRKTLHIEPEPRRGDAKGTSATGSQMG